MKKRMYGWLLMVLLVASACATDAVFDEPEVVWPPSSTTGRWSTSFLA